MNPIVKEHPEVKPTTDELCKMYEKKCERLEKLIEKTKKDMKKCKSDMDEKAK